MIILLLSVAICITACVPYMKNELSYKRTKLEKLGCVAGVSLIYTVIGLLIGAIVMFLISAGALGLNKLGILGESPVKTTSLSNIEIVGVSACTNDNYRVHYLEEGDENVKSKTVTYLNVKVGDQSCAEFTTQTITPNGEFYCIPVKGGAICNLTLTEEEYEDFNISGEVK